MTTGAARRLKTNWALRALRHFARDRRGGVAVMFGIAFPVLTLMTFFAVDYSRISLAKQKMQEALDAAALIAARSSAVDSNGIDAAGDAAFGQQIPDDVSGLTPDGAGRIAGATFTLNNNTVTATAQAEVVPIFFKVFTGRNTTIHGSTQVVRSLSKLEIAMVLDTTGSMAGTKISRLITASKNFITTMESAAARSTEPNPVKISIVPFSTTVRVNASTSMSSYNTASFSMSGLPTWLDGRARALAYDNDIFTNATNVAADRQDRFAKLKAISQPWGGCVEARVAPYDIRETPPSAGDVNSLFIPYFAPDEPDTGSYNNNYLTDDTTSTNWKIRQLYPAKYDHAVSAGPNDGCDMQGLMRLSTNWTALRNQVGGLNASGETNIPLGLMWGWHSLSPLAPFADGVPYGTDHVQKIIVLMTDGDNTMSTGNGSNNSSYHGYGYIWQNRLGTTSGTASTRTTKMNQRMVNGTNEALCKNIKAAGITIYAVGVGVSTSSKTLLQQCSSGTDFYYDVDSQAGNLNAAFDAIAGSIQNLRITR